MDHTHAATATAVAAFTDDACEIPLIDITDHGAGIMWTVGRVVELSRRFDNAGVVVDPGGPANSLIPRLQEYGLTIHEVSARDLAQACGGFYDAVSLGELRHRGFEPLDQAVQGPSGALLANPGRLTGAAGYV